MLGWFRKLLPREDRFFELFDRHAHTVVAAAEALEHLLSGRDVEANCDRIVTLEKEADAIAGEVMLAVRRSFITPFDRTDIQDLIQSMDDAIDVMNKTVRTVRRFETTEFDPLMREMGGTIADAARLVASAVPLLAKANANAHQLATIAEEVTRVEERSDELYERGLKDLFHRHRDGNAMAYLIGSEIYGQLEKAVDRFEDVANEISGIVIENV